MTNILNLPYFNVVNVSELELDYQVQAEVAKPPTQCAHCNHSEIVGFGRRDEMIMDIPVLGKRTVIMLNRRRYRCQSCRKTFLEPVPNKDDKRQMTHRLIQYIEGESLRRTFSGVAEDVGVDEKTIRNIFNDYCERLERSLQFEMPQWLGIDEIHIIKPRCLITNIEMQTIVNMLDNRNNSTVARYLSTRKDRDQVRYVAMDMWQPYRDAVANMIPYATVIIDKFHVYRIANESLERARKALRSDLTTQQRRGLMRDRFVLLKRRSELTVGECMRLDVWKHIYPELGQAYDLKEAFFDIWNCKNRHQAQDSYYAWLRQITPDMMAHFDQLIETMESWHDEIFNYFDHPITNAYTECINNLSRVVNCVGRGYSFDALRANILFTEGFRRQHYGVAERGPSNNFGVDILKLVREIEAGRF